MSRKITWKASPNHMSRQGHKPIMIVNHIGEGSTQSNLSWLTSSKSETSSNYIVGTAGDLYQLVSILNAAWCNGTSTKPSSKTYYGKATNKIVRDKKTNANYFTVSIEHSGYYKDHRGNIPEIQYQSTLWLHKHIIKEVEERYNYKIPISRDHIVGHYEINPVTKPNCPGQKFPFDRLIKDLKAWNYGSVDSKSPSSKTPILGNPRASLYQMQKWAEGKGADEEFVKLAPQYIYYSKAYGVDPVVTYTQSAKETGFFKFGGVLDKSFKNTCGMKTTGGGDNYDPNAHQRFKNWNDGIRAQVQHLALYAGQVNSPYADAIDPRHFPYLKGTAPNVEDLGGKWAGSKSYGTDIVKMMTQVMNTKVTADDIKRLDEKYGDSTAQDKVVEKFEETPAKVEEDTNAGAIVIAYRNDGDLANALALYNALPDAVLIKTTDATNFKDNQVIQVGGHEIKGANKVLAGKGRAETLEKVAEFISGE